MFAEKFRSVHYENSIKKNVEKAPAIIKTIITKTNPTQQQQFVQSPANKENPHKNNNRKHRIRSFSCYNKE